MTEVRSVSASGGVKGVKQARFALIPSLPLWKVAEVYGKGAEKYSPDNWRLGYEWSKSYDALHRHLNQFWSGEDLDEDGLPHLAHAVFHCLALIEWGMTHPEFDDRPATVRAKEEQEKSMKELEKLFGAGSRNPCVTWVASGA